MNSNSKTTLKMVIGVLSVTALAACGGFKVGVDDETLAAAECIAKPSTCSDDSSTTDSSDSSSDSDTTSSSDNSGDTADSTGGIASLPDDQKGGDSYFMGTYKLSSIYSYPYFSCTDEFGNGYDFPGIVRAYSYDNKIDFEDNYGNLDWIAAVYPDDTFDFMVQFSDSFGRPSNTVACTCTIDAANSYYYYDAETISCTCDPTYAGDEVCALTYEGM